MLFGLIRKGLSRVVPESRGLTQFTNCSLLKGGRSRREDLWVRGGCVVDHKEIFFDEKRVADEVVDMCGALLAPGLIDLQLNGAFGVDFTTDVDRIEECIATVSRGLVSLGVTGFCPTLITADKSVYRRATGVKLKGCEEGASPLGFHMEGPFISPTKKGVHEEKCIRSFDSGADSLLEVYGDLKEVSIVTLAPEKSNALEAIERLSGEGVVPSIGHSDGTLEECLEAVDKGASMVTHMFNAITQFKAREPGVMGLLGSPSKKVKIGLISDGVHSHGASLWMARRLRQEDIVLVTDGVSPMGCPQGTPHNHQLAHRPLEVTPSGVVYIKGSRDLSGTAVPLLETVRRYACLTGATPEEALEGASLRPAQVLGLAPNKGVLQPGSQADFIALDDNLVLKSTWIKGKCVFDSKNSTSQ